MPKSKSKRMKPVNQLAEKKQQQSAVVYSEATTQLRAMENQLEKLYSYRAGYNQQMIELSQSGVGTHRLQDTLMFMNNLNQSIEGLSLQIQEQKKVCEAKKQLWLATRNKTKIYLKVTEKYIVEEKLVLQKNEQKLADEFNQSLFYRRMSKADHNSNS